MSRLGPHRRRRSSRAVLADPAGLPLMKARRHGHIVNITSTGLNSPRRTPRSTTPASGACWDAATRCMSRAGRRVKVTAVIAGGMRTPFLLDRFPDLDPGLLQDPQNIADTMRFVLSRRRDHDPRDERDPDAETSWP